MRKSGRKDIQHFCFCLGLRSGSIILTVWWLISGLILSIYLFYSLNYQNAYTRIEALRIAFALESAMVFVVALFGLRALVTRNTILAIRIYAKLAWLFMVVLWSLLSAATLVFFIASKKQYEDMCPDCEYYWKSNLMKLLVGTILTSVFNIYFATILQVYIMRREERLKYQKYENPQGSLISGMSTNLTQPSSIISFMKKINSSRSRPVSLQSDYQPRRPLTYMSLNNVVVNQGTGESRYHSMVGDATATVADGYNNNSNNNINNDNSHNDSMVGVIANLDQVHEHPSPYEHPQYIWGTKELEQNLESLLGTMDITEYKNWG